MGSGQEPKGLSQRKGRVRLQPVLRFDGKRSDPLRDILAAPDRRPSVTEPTSIRPPGLPLSRRQLAAITLGNGFEFYDFTVYGFFAVPIGRVFFPTVSPWTSLLLSVAVFGVGFGARPLGAVVFGAYADRHGARSGMLLTVVLMTVGTLMVVVLPGYAVLGPAAPLLMVVARLVQGFALGGEIGPSTTFLLERARPGQRARSVSWQIALHGAAVLAAGILGYTITTLLPAAAREAWGWRLAMLFGLGILPVGLVLRASLPRDDAPARRSPRPPFRSALARPHRLAAAVVVIMSGTVPFYISGYLTSFAVTGLGMAPALALLAAVASGAATLVAAPLGGRAADRLGRRPVLVASRLGMAALAGPGFLWLAGGGGLPALLIVSGGLAAFNTFGSAAGLCMILESFPAGSRATGLGIVYALGVSLFGGLTQFAATGLTMATGDPLSPAYLLMGAGLAGIVAAFGLPGTAKAAPRAA